MGAMSFPSRRSSNRPTPPHCKDARVPADESLASTDLGNSALSLPVSELDSNSSHAPTAPAPIFYDMYDDDAAIMQDSHPLVEHSAARQRKERRALDATDEEEDDRFRRHHSSDLGDPDTINLDIATPPIRPQPPHRRLVVDRYYRATALNPRSFRKRMSNPQTTLIRRHFQDAARASDHRPVDHSDGTHHLQQERERDRHRELDPDFPDLARHYSDDDYSRVLSGDDSLHVGDTNGDGRNLQSMRRKKFHSHIESPPKRKSRSGKANRASSKQTIEESPYVKHSSYRSHSAVTSAESRVYDAYTEAVQTESRAEGGRGGLRRIVELLRDNEGNPVIIEKAALVIGILCEKDPASRDAFGQFAAVQTLIQCLSMRISAKFDRALIVKTVTFALSSLLRDSPRNLRLFEMFDGPYKMGKAAASERYENIPDVPRNALRALSELKYHPKSSDGVTNHVLTNSSTSSKTIMYVLRSMALHEYRTDIQECGLDALRTLLARCSRGTINSSLLTQSAQTISTAFKLHRESHEVQWQCLTLMCDLDALREDMFSLRLDMEAFFGAFRSLMLNPRSDDNNKQTTEFTKSLTALVKRAVHVAGNIRWQSREFTEGAVEAGGVEALLTALDFFSDDSQMSDKICSILRVLLQSEEGRFRMSRVKSACAILDGIASNNERAAATLSP